MPDLCTPLSVLVLVAGPLSAIVCPALESVEVSKHRPSTVDRRTESWVTDEHCAEVDVLLGADDVQRDARPPTIIIIIIVINLAYEEFKVISASRCSSVLLASPLAGSAGKGNGRVQYVTTRVGCSNGGFQSRRRGWGWMLWIRPGAARTRRRYRRRYVLRYRGHTPRSARAHEPMTRAGTFPSDGCVPITKPPYGLFSAVSSLLVPDVGRGSGIDEVTKGTLIEWLELSRLCFFPSCAGKAGRQSLSIRQEDPWSLFCAWSWSWYMLGGGEAEGNGDAVQRRDAHPILLQSGVHNRQGGRATLIRSSAGRCLTAKETSVEARETASGKGYSRSISTPARPPYPSDIPSYGPTTSALPPSP